MRLLTEHFLTNLFAVDLWPLFFCVQRYIYWRIHMFRSTPSIKLRFILRRRFRKLFTYYILRSLLGFGRRWCVCLCVTHIAHSTQLNRNNSTIYKQLHQKVKHHFHSWAKTFLFEQWGGSWFFFIFVLDRMASIWFLFFLFFQFRENVILIFQGLPTLIERTIDSHRISFATYW